MTDALTKTGLGKATMENRQYGHIYKCDLYVEESVSHWTTETEDFLLVI